MKGFLILILMCWFSVVHAQDKTGFVGYNKLIDLKGTDYAIATLENQSKLAVQSEFLLFLNTISGDSKQIEFPKGAQIDRIEHIRIDSLKLHKVLVAAKTTDADGSKSINWSDPVQLFLFNISGAGKMQLTDNKFYVRSWLVKRGTGMLLITGYYDTNGNRKLDREDKNEIMIYDLRAMNFVKKI